MEDTEFQGQFIKSFRCGGTHTVVQTGKITNQILLTSIDQDQLFVCGSNINGQLGLGFSTHQLKFRLLKTLPEQVRLVATGSSHTVFLTRTFGALD